MTDLGFQVKTLNNLFYVFAKTVEVIFEVSQQNLLVVSRCTE
ncbi:Uncharacterised protein [Vibrio cholerae]|nr:Uncharacterised protein [Vibrio cholerae]